jgi:hypothetical protein
VLFPGDAVAALRIAAFLVIASLAGCAGEGSDIVDAGMEPDTAMSCGPTLTYASFGAGFFSGYCGGCHGWTQASAQQEGSVLASVVTSGAMPPGGGVPASTRQEFADWIGCGAP